MNCLKFLVSKIFDGGSIIGRHIHRVEHKACEVLVFEGQYSNRLHQVLLGRAFGCFATLRNESLGTLPVVWERQ